MAREDSFHWRREQDGETHCWECDKRPSSGFTWHRRVGFSPCALLCHQCWLALADTPIGEYSQEADYVDEVTR